MRKTVNVYGFPQYVTMGTVVKFLEDQTYEGSVIAVKLRSSANGARKYAVVQFSSGHHVEKIISLCDRTLYFGSSCLKARELETDIVPKTRIFMHSMEDVKIHFGCQISVDKFCVFWGANNVSVNFAAQLRKIYFNLSEGSRDYKIELPYENLWQIHLHRSPAMAKQFLVIQLYGAPYIYEKETLNTGSIYDDPLLNYFKITPDDQWVRTTDFTPASSIGQSSCICVEIPYGHILPNLEQNFAFFKKSDGHFILRSAFSYSQKGLVPIIGPPRQIKLPFELLFKLNILVQNGCLAGPAVDAEFFRMIDPHRFHITHIENALERLYYLKECCYNPVDWLDGQYKKYRKSKRPQISPAISLVSGLVYIRRVQITPTKVYFCGPEINVSNRVLRHYRDDTDNFLRVNFIDEDWDKMHSTDLSPRSSAAARTKIYSRILNVLREGIVIGDKKFEFLAFSSSQLRDNSTWMFASRPGLDAGCIRKWMGDFHRIRNVAKYAARLGQSFGSSMETLTVERNEVSVIPDIEVNSGGIQYNFSDGIGKISAAFARQVAKKCDVKDFIPSAFQIRYGGYKGVVAVDPTMSSTVKLALRGSMCKYESDNTKLDVLGWSKFQPCFLNRQLITLLSTLGVNDLVFERKQKQIVDQLNTILTHPMKALEVLDLMAPGENTNILKEMLLVGYKPDAEPFLSMMLSTFRALKLLELRTKSRMFVQNGRAMMGCLDETRTLKYGQVFVQYSAAGYGPYISSVQGKVVVAKNPCLHPGDVRVLTAIDVPALRHMVDCVVFPQCGVRPHPNECSGSDLDGDIYFVCWDPELIPPQQSPPMDYTPAPSKELDHDVTIEEVEEYFTDYIVNDSLGVIANAHIAFADSQIGKAMSEPCIELAKLFSVAVDFPKTGVPAIIPNHLRVKEYPDFMEKHDKTTYKSVNVIGKLFREVKDISLHSGSIQSFTSEVAWKSYDYDMQVDGFEEYVEDAIYHKENYDTKLGDLLDYYGIKSEAEILSGSIMKFSRSFNKRRDAEAIIMAVRSLRKEARSWFNDNDNDNVFAKASAWYHVTYHPDYCGYYNDGLKRDHYLSFAWCVYDKLIHIKRERQSLRKTLQLSSLEHQFRNVLNL
uniref:RNA-dependent RNA polymerase n=1 Tax=Kalanchoe fedtschenkoi TaxID=63787 RepID=A0A7N0TG81_KALFE